VGIAHWDDVQSRRNERGQMAATWFDLGRAAGTDRCGLRRLQMGPREMPTPVHVHGEAEEIFYVLDGSGLTWINDKAYEVRAGDCIVYANAFDEHTIRGGEDGLDVLAFGAREFLPAGELPRGRSMWSVTGWIEVHDGHPWDREPPLEWPEPSPRPAGIVNVADAVADEWSERDAGGVNRALGREAGSRQTGLNHETIEPGRLNSPPHCHSSEEEIFVVLDGEATLLLGDEEHPLRAGHVVARPPGTGIPHAFRAETELTMLSYGTREPNDITYYPRSDVLWLRGVKLAARLERVPPEEIW